MSIDPGRWVNTLPYNKKEFDNENFSLDTSKWIDTLPKKNKHISFPKKNKYVSLKSYFVTVIFFIIGLAAVSIIKDQTRNLQKEINNLESTINVINQDLYRAILDHDVITSPKNLSILAEKYLETDLISYKISQIQNLNEKNEVFYLDKAPKTKDKQNIKEKAKETKYKIQKNVEKKIKMKKEELKKLKEMYSKPEKLPRALKAKVEKKINQAEKGLKQLYSDPRGTINSGRVQKWAVIQVVKAFFGIPIVPGK